MALALTRGLGDSGGLESANRGGCLNNKGSSFWRTLPGDRFGLSNLLGGVAEDRKAAPGPPQRQAYTLAPGACPP
ncbi:unnamed protein product [Nezara viridula]|uniref:Uncharacterized protein n=1 Tax=Nezara viridula TaxID=85310 RepID=A0A9P0H1U8_NEZVI|nr:unnamed protein product [Nezara viridula]